MSAWNTVYVTAITSSIFVFFYVFFWFNNRITPKFTRFIHLQFFEIFKEVASNCFPTESIIILPPVEYSDSSDVIHSKKVHHPPRICVLYICVSTHVFGLVCTPVAIHRPVGHKLCIRRRLFCCLIYCDVKQHCQI